tara:strand:- start:174 stop:491 length:318 start_codon:yes stop_codon:yes gene_type:complete
MSEALAAISPGMTDVFRNAGVNVCPHGFVRGAQDLARVLKSLWGTHSLGFESPGSPPSSIAGKQGVICYMNIPTFRGQGHIDLWNRSAPVGQAYWEASPIWFWNL